MLLVATRKRKNTVHLRITALRMWLHIERVYQRILWCLDQNISNNNSRLCFADVFILHLRLTATITFGYYDLCQKLLAIEAQFFPYE